MNSRKIFFPNLDALRSIAFLMVFLWHTLKTPFEMAGIQDPWLQKIFYLFVNGQTGVSIFFVLSGFLITYLILAEIEINGKPDIIKFYIRRCLRIWPLYFLLLMLAFIAIPLTMKNIFHFNWEGFDMRPWFYFLFLSNFDVLHIYLTNGKDLLASTITWSVAIEEQFYIVWPLLFSFIPVKFYKYIFPVLLLAAYIFRSFYAGNPAILHFHTVSVCGDLALGGWVAWLSFTKREFVLLFENQSNKKRASLYLVSVVILYFLQFAENDFTRVFGRLLQTIFFCYIILDQNFSKQNFLKLSNNRVLSFWGKYTYGLYLWHPVVLLGLTVLFSRVFHFSLQHYTLYLIVTASGLACSLLISYYSYHFFEGYFLNLKKKFALIDLSQA